jgi:outer membrane murein-binding lipoprotein Lpp
MSSRDIILVGAGIVAGYLLVGIINKNKSNIKITDTSSISTVDQAKLADCTKKVGEQMSAQEFTANFDINAYKKDAINRCLKGQMF